MKSMDKQYERASNEVAERVRKLLKEIRPILQQKHQMSDALTDAAITKGVGVVVVECSKIQDVPADGPPSVE
jgi:hypothetical protein